MSAQRRSILSGTLTYLSNYPGYSRELPMGLPEISRVTRKVCTYRSMSDSRRYFGSVVSPIHPWLLIVVFTQWVRECHLSRKNTFNMLRPEQKWPSFGRWHFQIHFWWSFCKERNESTKTFYDIVCSTRGHGLLFPGALSWRLLPIWILFCCPILCSSFGNRAPLDFIYGCSIFK